jgi:predicted phage tail protein
MAIKVRLHGILEDFDKGWEFDISTPLEAIDAIDANTPGFRNFVSQMELSLMYVENKEGKLNEDDVTIIDQETATLPIGADGTLHILPVVEGDIETAFFVGTALLTDLGLPVWLAATIAAVAIATVVVVAAIGIAKLLAPTPPSLDTEDAKPSHYFNGALNLTQQGNPCPLLYGGPLIVGSQVVSMAIQTDRIGKFRSTAIAEIVDVISEGEIEGYAGTDLESSIYFDDVPVKSNGELNFDDGFDFEFKEGTNTQSVTSLNNGMSAKSFYSSINVQVTKASGPVIRATQPSEEIDRVEVTLYIQSLLKLDDDGDKKSRSFTVEWFIQGQGYPYISVERRTVKGKTTTGYYLTLGEDIDRSVYGDPPYNVKVERKSSDDNNVNKLSAFSWQSMSEIINAKMRYPNSAYMVTRLNAKKFGSLPKRGYYMKGIKVRVPSNYNPVTRTYSGAWNGSFSGARQFTNNPAWIIYDLCTNERYGLGEYITDEMMDKWSLYTISQYCDELVDDGYGGQEPRFTSNTYVQSLGDALQVLRDICSSLRTIFFWYNGQLRFTQDVPETPVAQFTPANVVQGMFNYTGTPKYSRYTAAMVTWFNPDKYFEADQEYIEDREGIALYGLRVLTMTAIGCTSRGQAVRTGKYALLTGRLETDAVSFKTGLDATFLQVGRIIKIIDPLKNQSDENVGGRITAATDTSVTLDREVTLDGGETYTITLIQPDGTQTTRAITNGAGTVTPPSSITWSAALDPNPGVNSVWSITKDSESECLYKVISIKEPSKGDAGKYEISGVMHDPDKYDLADDPGELPGPLPPELPAPGAQPVRDLAAELGVVDSPDGVKRFIDLFWTPPDLDSNGRPFNGYYEIIVEYPDLRTETYTTYDHSFRVREPELGLYTFTVYAISPLDLVRSPPESVSVTVDELAQIDLYEVTGLELMGQGNDTTFEGRDAQFEWRFTSITGAEIGGEEAPGDTGTVPPWFKDFEITILDTSYNELRVEYTAFNEYTYDYQKNLADGGPRREFIIQVRGRDIYNRETDEAELSVSNPVPIGFNSIDITEGIESMVVSITPPDDNDFARTRCYVSQTQGFSPSPENMLYEGSDWVFTIEGLTQIYYYVRLEPVDDFGPSGNYTAEQEVQLTTVSRIRNQLVGAITETELYQNLNSRIDLIDTHPTLALIPRVTSNESRILTLEQTSNLSNTTYHQDTDPQLGVPTPSDPVPELLEGDLWIDSSSADVIKRWDGTGWDTLESSGSQVFYRDGPPTAPYDGPAPDPSSLAVGDYWVDIGTTVPTEANHPYIWNGLSWVSARDKVLTQAVVDITSLQAELDDPDNGLTIMAQLVTAANVEVFGAAGSYPNSNIYANANAIQVLQTDVQNLSSGTLGVDPIRQDTPPTTRPPDGSGDPLEVQDIWIDTDDDDHPYYWDGGQWVDLVPLDNKITAATAVEAHTRITQDLLAFAEYTIKVDVNGHIAGIGLSVEGGVSGGTRSEIICLADRFSIGFPTYEFIPSGANYVVGHFVTPTQAFVDANGTPDADGVPRWDHIYKVVDVNGSAGSEPVWPQGAGATIWSANVQFQEQPVSASIPFTVGTYNAGTDGSPDYQTGVVLGYTFIESASIDYTHIKDATITTAKIADLNVDKLTSGTINVDPSGIYLGSTNFWLSSQYRRIDIRDDQGSPQLRVRMGALYDSPSVDQYGLQLYKANGDLILSTETGVDSGTMGLGDMAFLDQITSGNADLYISSAAIGSAHISSLFVTQVDGDIQRIEDFTQQAVPGGHPNPGDTWSGTWELAAAFTVTPTGFDRYLDFPAGLGCSMYMSATSTQQSDRMWDWGVRMKVARGIDGGAITDLSGTSAPWYIAKTGSGGATSGSGQTRASTINTEVQDGFTPATTPTHLVIPSGEEHKFYVYIDYYVDFKNNPNSKIREMDNLENTSQGQLFINQDSEFTAIQHLVIHV